MASASRSRQPGEQRGAALAGEHGAGRVLVGGREDDGVVVRASSLDAQPVVVDRDRARARGPARRAISSCSGLAGSSIAMRRAPPVGERVAEQRERLGVAARDHDARRRRRPRRGRGRGSRRAPARSVSRPIRVAVLEVGVGHRRERLAGRAQPGGAREASRRRGRWGGSRSAAAAAARARGSCPLRGGAARPTRAGARPAGGSGSPRRRAGRRRRPRRGARRRAGGRGRGCSGRRRRA